MRPYIIIENRDDHLLFDPNQDYHNLLRLRHISRSVAGPEVVQGVCLFSISYESEIFKKNEIKSAKRPPAPYKPFIHLNPLSRNPKSVLDRN